MKALIIISESERISLHTMDKLVILELKHGQRESTKINFYLSECGQLAQALLDCARSIEES